MIFRIYGDMTSRRLDELELQALGMPLKEASEFLLNETDLELSQVEFWLAYLILHHPASGLAQLDDVPAQLLEKSSIGLWRKEKC